MAKNGVDYQKICDRCPLADLCGDADLIKQSKKSVHAARVRISRNIAPKGDKAQEDWNLGDMTVAEREAVLSRLSRDKGVTKYVMSVLLGSEFRARRFFEEIVALGMDGPETNSSRVTLKPAAIQSMADSIEAEGG